MQNITNAHPARKRRIDTVLLPKAMTEAAAEVKNLVDVATDAGVFNTLLAAVTAAGLAPVLMADGAQFTILAPTDEAFAKLGAIVTDLVSEAQSRLKRNAHDVSMTCTPPSSLYT